MIKILLKCTHHTERERGGGGGGRKKRERIRTATLKEQETENGKQTVRGFKRRHERRGNENKLKRK